MNKKFKRTLAGLTAFLMAFSAAAIPQVADSIGLSVVASAAGTLLSTQHVENGIRYAIYNDNTAKVHSTVNSTNVTDVTIPEKVTYNNKEYTVTAIGQSAFDRCTNLKNVTIPNTVTDIENGAFQLCSSLTSITIPDGVTTIGDWAFNYCTGLTSINIPENVTTIGKQTFYHCQNLESITIPSSVISIGELAFGDCDKLTNVTIPEGVTTIGDSAFQYCNELASVSIPSSVTSIGNGVFASCYKLTTITLAKGNESYIVENNVLFNKAKTELVAYPSAKTETTYSIPSGVSIIKAHAFKGCRLESLTIPETVTTIEDNAFESCNNFTRFEIPSSVTSLGEGVFNQCYDLKAITVAAENSNYSAVDGVLFDKDMKTLIAYPCGKTDTSYIIPNGVDAISNDAFYVCENIKSVTIPASVKTIGDNAFLFCENLATVTISEGVQSIGNSAFSQCKCLESIEIPNSVTSIGENAFSLCSGLKNVKMGNGVTKIGRFAFQSCTALESVTLSDKITEISNQAFYGCSALKELTIPETVTKIGSWAFNGCSGLSSLNIPNGVTVISGGAFYGCSGLTSLTIPGGVTDLQGSTFGGCTNLKTLTLPKCFESENWDIVRPIYGIPETTEIIFSSNAVTYNSEYVTVTKGDGTPVENGAEIKDDVELVITVKVPEGMKLNSVTANGVALSAQPDGTYKFTTSGGAAIVADVVAKEYPLAVTSNKNATIVVKDEKGNTLEDGDTIKYGEKFTVEVTPDGGYKTTAVNVENATLSDGYYTVNDDVADGASITVSATVEEKVFTITSLPENVTLLKNIKDEVTASANNTFKKGDKIAIYPHFGYDMVMVPMIKGISDDVIYTTGDGQGNAYYIFTGKEKDGEFTIFSGVEKCFKIDTANVPKNTKLYLRKEVGGEKSARAATEIVDYEVKATTPFYEGYMLVIKIDEGCKVIGKVKVGDTIVEADENGEYIYTFTGKEDNLNPIAVSATAKKASKIAGITESTIYANVSVKKNGEEVKAGDEVLEGDKLTIAVTTDFKSKLNRVVANGAVLSANEDGTYSFTVGTSDVTIDAEIAKPKSAQEVGYKEQYFAPVTQAEVISGLELIVTYDDGTVEYHVPITDDMISNFTTTEENFSFTLTYGTLKGTITKPLTAVAVERIAVTKDLTNREYKVGEELSLDGGVITVYNNDGTSTTVNMSDASVSVTGYDTTTEPNSDLKLTITYKNNGVDYTTEYSIVVVAADAKEVSDISISTQPTKTAYFVGDELSVDGKITVTYSDGSSEDIDITPAMVTGFDSSAAAEKQTLTVTYGGKTAAYDISVTAVEITGITVTAPTKTNYMVGDSLDLTGGYITVTYNNGKEETLPLVTAGVSVSALDSSAIGEKTITVTYNGKSGSFKVNVAEKSYKVNFTDATVKSGETALITGESVAENTVLTVTATAKSGYTATLKVNGQSVSGTTTTITVINDVTISVDYTKNSGGSSGGSGGSSGGSSSGSSSGGSSSGGSSSTTKNPTVDGKETTWTDVASDIAKLTEGKTETIELSGGKTVPVEVVKAIASSNAEVTLKVDEVFSWTVDGADIDPKDAKAADFSITKTTVAADNTPRGTRGTSFSIKGTNVKSELNINFKATHSGEFANLYKKVDGKLVFVDNVKVDKNGAASGLEVSEKGEYVVMLGKYSDRAGDMDNDGIINPKDSYAILRNFLDIEEGENPLVADINGDGFINAKDAYQVLVEYLNIG